MPFASTMTFGRTTTTQSSASTASSERTERTRGAAAAALAASSAATALPRPPETPTRSLLERIQRRSSTNAETLLAMASSSRIRKTTAHTHGTPSSSSPASASLTTTTAAATVVAAKPSSFSLRRRGSTSTLNGLPSGLPRHARTLSNVAQTSRMNGVKSAALRVDEMGKIVNGATKQPSLKNAPAATAASKNDEVTLQHTIRTNETLPHSMSHPSTVIDSPCSLTSSSHKDLPSPNVEVKKRLRPASVCVDRSVALRQVTSEGQGLTREAAIALEQEFGEQERILQGLQRDNERKTVEVEELRRQKNRLEEFCARYFGQEHWRDVVFASTTEKTTIMSEARPTEATEAIATSGSPYDDEQGSVSPSQAIVEDLLRPLHSPPNSPASPSIGRRNVIASPPSLTPLTATKATKLPSSWSHSVVSQSCPSPNVGANVPMCSSPLRATQSIFDDDLSLSDSAKETTFASATMGPSPTCSPHKTDERVYVTRKTLNAVVEAQQLLLRELHRTC